MMKNPETRECKFCGAPFVERHPTQKFCSYDCRFRQRGQDQRLAKEAAKAPAAAQ